MPVASIDISWYFGVEWQCYNVLHPQFKHLICNFWLKTAVRFAADVLLFEGSGHLNSTFVRLYFKVFSWASVCTEKKSPLAINTSLLIALQFCGFICFSRSSQFYFIFLWLTINVFFFPALTIVHAFQLHPEEACATVTNPSKVKCIKKEQKSVLGKAFAASCIMQVCFCWEQRAVLKIKEDLGTTGSQSVKSAWKTGAINYAQSQQQPGEELS